MTATTNNQQENIWSGTRKNISGWYKYAVNEGRERNSANFVIHESNLSVQLPSFIFLKKIILNWSFDLYLFYVSYVVLWCDSSSEQIVMIDTEMINNTNHADPHSLLVLIHANLFTFYPNNRYSDVYKQIPQTGDTILWYFCPVLIFISTPLWWLQEGMRKKQQKKRFHSNVYWKTVNSFLVFSKCMLVLWWMRVFYDNLDHAALQSTLVKS